MWPSGGGTHAAGWGAAVTIVPVAATASCAAVSAAGVEEISGAGLAGAKVCPSGSGRDGDELSHIGGPDRFAGVSNGEPGATDSIGAAGGGASASAPAGEEFTAAGWGGAPGCARKSPDSAAELDRTAGAGGDAGTSGAEPDDADSIGVASGGASASAPAGEEFTAAGWGGAPVCGSGCPDGKAELIQNGACGLSSLRGDGAV
jgi:hypothetical protein